VGPEFRVNTSITGYQDHPALASDGNGNFVVVWDGVPTPGSAYIFGQRYASSGAPLGPEFRVNAFTGSESAVASDPSGNFVVVWTSAQDPGFGIFGQRFASSGVPVGTAFRVNTYTTDIQSRASIANDSSGNFVVVWQSLPQEGSDGIFGQRFASSGAPLGGEFRVNTYTTGAQFSTHISSDPAGNFVVVYYRNLDGTGGGIFGQRYAASGVPLGGEFRINTYTTSAPFRPSVAADSSGNFVVVWTSHLDGSLTGIFGQRYDASGATVGGEFRVNTFTMNHQDYPSVGGDDSGNFVVVWQSEIQDGSGYGIFGQRYDSAGSPLGGEFRVTTYTTSAQRHPSVTSDRAGHFVVAWGSNLQDGSSYGVFGQRFSQMVPVELVHFGVE